MFCLLIISRSQQRGGNPLRRSWVKLWCQGSPWLWEEPEPGAFGSPCPGFCSHRPPSLALPGGLLPGWQGKPYQEDGWAPDSPPQAGWPPGWLGEDPFKKAHPEAQLGNSGAQQMLRGPSGIPWCPGSAWASPCSHETTLQPLWNILPSPGPDGNSTSFFQKKREREKEKKKGKGKEGKKEKKSSVVFMLYEARDWYSGMMRTMKSGSQNTREGRAIQRKGFWNMETYTLELLAK